MDKTISHTEELLIKTIDTLPNEDSKLFTIAMLSYSKYLQPSIKLNFSKVINYSGCVTLYSDTGGLSFLKTLTNQEFKDLIQRDGKAIFNSLVTVLLSIDDKLTKKELNAVSQVIFEYYVITKVDLAYCLPPVLKTELRLLFNVSGADSLIEKICSYLHTIEPKIISDFIF